MDRDLEEGPSPAARERNDAAPLEIDDQRPDVREVELHHPIGGPVEYGPANVATREQEARQPSPTQPCVFWSESAQLEHAIRTQRPVHLAEAARRRAESRQEELPVDTDAGTGERRNPVTVMALETQDSAAEEMDASIPVGRTRQPQLEADRAILSSMRDLLTELVAQGHRHAERLERLEMQSASSGQSRNSRVSREAQEGLRCSHGHGKSAAGVAGPPREATGCQYFYIGDAPTGPAASSDHLVEAARVGAVQGSVGKSSEPTQMDRAQLLQRLFQVSEEDYREVRKYIDDNMLSGSEVETCLAEFLAHLDRRAGLDTSRRRGIETGAENPTLSQTPTFAGGGLQHVHDSSERFMLQSMLSVPNSCRPLSPTSFRPLPPGDLGVLTRGTEQAPNPFNPLPSGNLGIWTSGTGNLGSTDVGASLSAGLNPGLGSFGIGRTATAVDRDPLHAPTTPRVQPAEGDHYRRGMYSPGDKAVWELPKLPEIDPTHAPLQAGDWITIVTPMMNDLAPYAGEYWGAVMVEAERLYSTWQHADPLTKAQVVAVLPASLRHQQFARLENRALSMLLRSIPETLKEEIISSRNMNTVNVLFKIFTSYQPGGLRERGMLLGFLTSPGSAGTVHEAVVSLRKWFRWLQRTSQMGATLPDVSLLVQGLDGMSQSVLAQLPHVQFRMNMVRTQCGIDHNPSLQALQIFARSLQAELEAAAVGQPVSDAPTSPKKPRLNALGAQPSDPSGKGSGKDQGKFAGAPTNPKGGKAGGKGNPGATQPGGGSSSPLPLNQSLNPSSPMPSNTAGSSPTGASSTKKCSFYLRNHGCRLGSSCTFFHDTEAAKDQQRCFNCGAKGHRKPQCEAPGGPKHNPEATMPPSQKAHNGSAQNTSSEQRPPAPKNGVPQATGVTPKAAALKPEDILANATAMLQGLRVASVSDPKLATFRAASSSTQAYEPGERLQEDDTMYGLIDGGATNPLREGDASEISDARLVTVQLATGQAQLWVNRVGTILADFPVMPILPMGVLADELDCQILWEGPVCRVTHPEHGDLDITMRDRCPHLSKHMTLSLISELERRRATNLVQAARLRMLLERQSGSFEDAWSRLQNIGRGGIVGCSVEDWIRGVDSALFTTMASLFADVPNHQLLRALEPVDFDVSYRPKWNRRLRRSLERSQGVLVHVCSGDQHWVPRPRSDFRVLCIDARNGVDILDYSVWAYLLRLSKLGLIRGITGGPPCSFECHSAQDEGPRRVRGRGDGTRYGVAGLSTSEQQMVDNHNQIWMRTVMLFLSSQAISGDVYIALEQPRDPATFTNGSLHESSCPSIADWPAIQKLVEFFGWRIPMFDQSALGSVHKKPTMLYTSSWDLYVLLHNRLATMPSPPRAEPLHGSRDSREMSGWAPGLTMAILKCWDIWITETRDNRLARAFEQSHYLHSETQGQHDYLYESRTAFVEFYGEIPSEIIPSIRQPGRSAHGPRSPAVPITLPRLARVRLTAQEQDYKRHIERGHFPFRRDCAVCLRSGGRSRPMRRRPPTSDSYSISVDLGGPYKPGLSELLHLKHAPLPRYLFVAVYHYPVHSVTHKLLWADSVEPDLDLVDPEVGRPGQNPLEETDVEPQTPDMVDPDAGKPGQSPVLATEPEQLEEYSPDLSDVPLSESGEHVDKKEDSPDRVVSLDSHRSAEDLIMGSPLPEPDGAGVPVSSLDAASDCGSHVIAHDVASGGGPRGVAHDVSQDALHDLRDPEFSEGVEPISGRSGIPERG